MKFGLFFANAGPFASPDVFEALVATAEGLRRQLGEFAERVIAKS